MRAARLLALVCLIGLVAASCSSDPDPDPGSAADTTTSAPRTDQAADPIDADETAGPATGSEPSPEPGPEASAIPSVAMIDVATRAEVDLASLAPADKPIVLWFWAPHCPTCRREAPGLEEFARAHADEVSIVGVGTLDDLDLADDFIASTGVTFPMLWEPSGESWRQYGVPAQPAWRFLTPTGEVVDGGSGGVDESRVLELAAEHA